MKPKISIFWFRRDLRIEDNVGLYHALSSGNKVLPLFVFDTDILENLDADDARVTFIHEELTRMHRFLSEVGSSLFVRRGKVTEVFKELIDTFDLQEVYTNRDYEPYATQRDEEAKDFLSLMNVPLLSFKDQVIFETNEIVKQDGSPYKVYTPYSKKWLSQLSETFYACFTTSDLLENFYKFTSNLISLEEIGFRPSAIKVLPFDTSESMVNGYEGTRNFPGVQGTSRLSPHLRFGTVSVRKCVQNALKSSNTTFLKELIWREFFMQILWHFPKTVLCNFKPKYDGILWRNKQKEYQAWCDGNTGYPIVDAGMRELNSTGFMHNRVRMITASFLCKHLLIDWRWGEMYFAKKLLDFDLAQNVGNWQWVAGTGCDAAPYFRIFNPTEQVKKFDKDFAYIKKWVPEFQELTYVLPIVNHKEARERCLKTYKEGLNNN